MSADVSGEDERQQLDEGPLTSHNIDMLLKSLIASNDRNDLSTTDDNLSEFPLEYDYSQPAKSWWRYFKKQTEENTALCYTCGAVFNRGPKQSTTSLSHHLKMYHRDQFILIQQAKDEDLRHNNNNGKSGMRTTTKRQQNNDESMANEEAAGDYLNRKKSAFNMSLIESIRQKSELYDNRQRQSDHVITELWGKVASEVGVSAQIAKKCWQSLSQRYRKEMKIAGHN